MITSPTPPAGPSIGSSAPGPVAETTSALDRTNLRNAFRTLSGLQKAIILGLQAGTTTVAEFATEHSLPVGMVRQELLAAMRHLGSVKPGTPESTESPEPWHVQRRTLLSALASAELVMEAEHTALEMIVARMPLGAILDVLTAAVEECCEHESVASILLVSPDGLRLHTGSAVSLPDSYNAAIDGLEIAPGVGTCLAAAAAREVVVTPDLAADPGWAGLSHLPLELGLKAAWSRPILGTDGLLLGTFGTYFRSRRRPTPTEFAVVTVLAHITAIAIERERLESKMESDREELRTLNAALAETNASLDEFVSLISHELLSPLTAIQGNIAFLQGTEPTESIRAGVLVEVDASAKRMMRTVNGLVVLARGGRAGADDLEPVRVGVLVRSICKSYLPTTNRIDFTSIDSGFGDIVIGSNVYIEQIIVNMLSNASKYGGASEAIDISVDSDSGSVRVTVSDRGRGIPLDEVSQVFTHFFRGRDGSYAQAGSGIGLTVCQRLAEFMGGTITFHGRPGGGTDFVLEMPRVAFPEE